MSLNHKNRHFPTATQFPKQISAEDAIKKFPTLRVTRARRSATAKVQSAANVVYST